MRAIVVEAHGGPEVLRLHTDRPRAEPGPHQVLVKVEAVGVNFIDVYRRTGRYPGPLPYTPGSEGAGVVERVGEEVKDLAPGTHVAWALCPGSYATHLVASPEALVPIPEGLSARDAAAALLQGMTSHYLATTTFPLRPGHTALVHAGAGGVGLLLTQMAKKRGARVLTTVSTEEKAELSRNAGADDVILYTQVDFASEVRRLTAGEGVHVVYDSVGQTTFDKSLGVLRPLGMMVLFGASSGQVPPFDPMVLNHRGSLFLTRPKLHDYIPDRPSLLARAREVLGWVTDGSLRLRVGKEYPLAEAGRAHEELERRRTTGKLLLVP